MVTIEPIKNQYLTALKERQQIIDKLNEIIRGLNALDFDDLTTIQSELVSIRESLQTQNTAITEINNSIGQIESELTSFDNRLITLNTNIENTESHLTSFENDTVLNLQSKVNKNGDTMTGNLGIPTTTTGTRNNLAVNGERLQNDLDNYDSMVRTTGKQDIYGIKNFNSIIYGAIQSAIINRSLGYHKVYSFGKNTGNKYIGMRIYDRYNYAVVNCTISFDTSVTPAKISISGDSTSTIGRTKIGVMYEPDNDEYLLIVNRASGNNIYTKIIVDFYQISTTSIENVMIQNVPDELVTVPENYMEIVGI